MRPARGLTAPKPNFPEFEVSSITLTDPLVVTQLPDVKVPDDCEALLKAHHDNNGVIFVGTTAASQPWTLPPGAATSFKIDNFNKIYVKPEIANDKLEYGVEQEVYIAEQWFTLGDPVLGKLDQDYNPII